MTDLSEKIAAHIALAQSADAVVTAFANKMIALAASEKAVRDAYIADAPGAANFARAGQTAIAAYLPVLAERLAAGETRPELVQSVGALAQSGWGNVA